MTKQARNDTQLVIIKIGGRYFGIDSDLETHAEVRRAGKNEEKWLIEWMKLNHYWRPSTRRAKVK